MARFEHLGGGAHSHSDGKDYKKGDIITTSADLENQFPGKFRRVDHVVSPEASPSVVATLSPPSPLLGVATTSSKKIQIKPKVFVQPKDARGDDVTEDWSDLEPGLKVFQRGEFFHVYEGEKTTPINPKGLKKQEVYSAVKKYLEE